MKNLFQSTACYVTWVAPTMRQQAQKLAAELDLPLLPQDTNIPDALLLELTPDRLQLRSTAPKAPGAVYADFSRLNYRRRQGSLRKEAIGRAAGLRGDHETTVLDATAGLGRDGFILACLGAQVTLVERSPLVAALLADGLRRAAADPELRPVLERIQLVNADAEPVLAGYSPQGGPEVVYLDPMYPESGTRAQVKKEMQLLRRLLGPDPDPVELLNAALCAAQRRVVVKRPAKAPPIGGQRPNHSIVGSSTRFDVYVIA